MRDCKKISHSLWHVSHSPSRRWPSSEQVIWDSDSSFMAPVGHRHRKCWDYRFYGGRFLIIPEKTSWKWVGSHSSRNFLSYPGCRKDHERFNLLAEANPLTPSISSQLTKKHGNLDCLTPWSKLAIGNACQKPCLACSIRGPNQFTIAPGATITRSGQFLTQICWKPGSNSLPGRSPRMWKISQRQRHF